LSLILYRTKKDLSAIKGISEAKVDKILEACAKLRVSVFMFFNVLKHFTANWIHDWFGILNETKRCDTIDYWF
jgi:hypothetical protein